MTDRTATPALQALAEAEIIGSLLRDRSLIAWLGAVEPTHFSDAVNREVYAAISGDDEIASEMAVRIAAPSVTDDHIALYRKATRQESSLRRAAKLVLDAARRNSVAASIRLAESNLAAGNDIDSVCADLQRSLAQRPAQMASATSAQQSARRLRDRPEAARMPIRTGLDKLDYVMHGGLHRSMLTALLARQKRGKTLMMATLAQNLSGAGIPTLAISLERHHDDLEEFIAARALCMDAADIRGRRDPEMQEALDMYADTPRPLWYVHAPAMTRDELVTRIRAEVAAHGIVVVLIDHWQLIRGAAIAKTGRPETREQWQAEAAQAVADLAAELDIAAFMTGQLNADGKPHGGEGILGSAGIVIQLNRPEDQAFATLETLVSNRGPERHAGTAAAPALQMHPHGPHFADVI